MPVRHSNCTRFGSANGRGVLDLAELLDMSVVWGMNVGLGTRTRAAEPQGDAAVRIVLTGPTLLLIRPQR
jgi:hypothetical protein